jgi:hypothetical protein
LAIRLRVVALSINVAVSTCPPTVTFIFIPVVFSGRESGVVVADELEELALLSADGLDVFAEFGALGLLPQAVSPKITVSASNTGKSFVCIFIVSLLAHFIYTKLLKALPKTS